MSTVLRSLITTSHSPAAATSAESPETASARADAAESWGRERERERDGGREIDLDRRRDRWGLEEASHHLILYSLKTVVKRNCVYKVHTHIRAVKCYGENVSTYKFGL